MRLIQLTFRSTLALAMVASLASAQGPFDPDAIHRAPIDEAEGGAPKFVAVAQISADLKPDVVLFGDGSCIFAFGPGAYDSHSYPESDPPQSISSWVRVPGAASGDPDRFLGSSGNALYLMSRSGGALEIEPLPITGWTNVGKIQVADFDIDGDLDVIGHASAGGGTFHVVEDVLTSIYPAVDTHTMPTGEHVREFVMMDWDGQGDLEMIAWCDNAGDSRVVKWSLGASSVSTVYDRPFVPPAGRLIALDYPASEPDRVAILFKAPTGSAWMLTTAWDGGNDERVLLDAAELIGVAAACLGGGSDVYPDILTTNKQGVARVYTNSGSTQAFGPTPSSSYDLLESSTSFDQMGQPALADLDNDGDLDLLCTVEATVGEYELVVLPGAYENRFAEAPQIDPAETYYYDDPMFTPPVLIQLRILPGVDHDLPNVDALELVVWAVDDECENPANSSPVVSGIFPVTGTWFSASDPYELVDLELPVSLGEGGLYALEMREVDRNASGDVVAAGPSVAWILHKQGIACDIVDLFPPVGLPEPVGLTALQTGSGNVIINVLPTLYVPPFTDEDYVDDPSTFIWPF